jgi:hypothetical protein
MIRPHVKPRRETTHTWTDEDVIQIISSLKNSEVDEERRAKY